MAAARIHQHRRVWQESRGSTTKEATGLARSPCTQGAGVCRFPARDGSEAPVESRSAGGRSNRWRGSYSSIPGRPKMTTS